MLFVIGTRIYILFTFKCIIWVYLLIVLKFAISYFLKNDWLTDRLTKRLLTSWLKILWYPYELIILNLFTLLAWIIHLYLLSCIPSFLTKNDWLTSRGSIHSLIGSYFAMQMLCTLPVLFIINKLLDMLNTLTKPRFQTFVKIFQGPTDRPTHLVLEAPPRGLEIYRVF